MAIFHLTQAAVAGMLGSTGLTETLGASPKIRIYDGTKPADADAALSGNTMLAELVCAASPIASVTDVTGKARATFNPIADDASADNTGTASFCDLVKSDNTVVGRGDVGTSAKALNLNTTAIAAASTVSITSAWIEQSEGGTY